MRENSQLIVRKAQDNPSWGYTRIQGALANLSHKVGCGTDTNVLKRTGIELAPKRSKCTTWPAFVKTRWKVLAASDFFTAEVWMPGGPVRHHVLFVMSLADRVVHIAGITTHPNEAWMQRVGRNHIDAESGALSSKRHISVDRGTRYTQQFRRLVEETGKSVIRLPQGSLHLNAYSERFVRSIKVERPGTMIFVGQAPLRRAMGEFMAHYHEGRNHQGLENALSRPKPTEAAHDDAVIHRRRRLGGMLNYYYRAAA